MDIFATSRTVKNIENHREIPGLDKFSKDYYGPRLRGLQRKSCSIYGVVALVGLLPAILKLTGMEVSKRFAACMLGLLIPGGGFIATSNPLCMAVGIYITYFTFTKGFVRNRRAGDKSWIAAAWAVGILGGLFTTELRLIGLIAVVIVLAAVIFHFWSFDRKFYKEQDELLERRTKEYDKYIELLEKIEKSPRPAQMELSDEQLKSARIIFDITTREIGDLSGIEVPKWSSNEFRYQMCYAGYGLLIMQRRFTPNFRGYMQHSLQYLVESFTSPEACGYWVTETLGGHGSLDFDPISPRNHDNIMLKGWIAPVLSGYRAVTGDDRYNQPKALKFRPFKDPNRKSYDYSVDDIIQILIEDWKANSLTLIPCEPHLVFTVCNSYPMIGVEMYDNDHDTDYAGSVYEAYIKALEEEFTEKSGSISSRKNMINGFNWYPARNFSDDKLGFAALPMIHAIDPGLAELNYAFFRREVLGINESGEALFYGKRFGEAFNFNAKSHNHAGIILGFCEQCAAEFGDWEMYDALHKAEKIWAPVSKNPFVRTYDGMNFANSICMATAKWMQKDDWTYLAHSKVSEAELNGPVLAECAYPDVLVARAVSTGSDLDLVIRNGLESKVSALKLAQLEPNQAYYDAVGGQLEFQADSYGEAQIEVFLDGRTHLHIVKK